MLGGYNAYAKHSRYSRSNSKFKSKSKSKRRRVKGKGFKTRKR